MDENLSKLLKQAKYHSETGLPEAIWFAIQNKQAKSLKIQSLVYGIAGILSLGGFVFMSISVVKEFIASGFFQYVSVAFGSNGLFVVYWKEYLLSLVDSLPVASLGALLFLLVSMLISFRKVMHQFKNQLLIS
ncbi:hypothetical protein HXX01_05410 [Candidatus Nomurabacteria bacterium]|nr:hypothetical protein [Candidatus Nomurabacteria bacterium]